MVLDAEPLEAARLVLGLSVRDLWVRCFALGGVLDVVTLGDSLLGQEPFTFMEFNVVAQALNERFMDDGGNHPVAYADGP